MHNNNKLGSSIAVMNAKGGVGKSTVTLAIAETLSHYYDKKVLVIDSDAQMSISVMLMPFDELNTQRANWKTLVGLLHQTLILGETPDWREFVTHNVADVDDTQTVDLLPGDLRLTLVERAVTEADRHEQMRGLVRSVLAEARLAYDYILIDCPPGLSLLTEIWLRESDYHLAPVKPDFLAIAGLEMFREFKKINPDLKMADNLGILVNMKNSHSLEDDNYHNILANDVESNCFPEAIPHMAPIQHAARFSPESRSYIAKYPGSAGNAFRKTVEEIFSRIGDEEHIAEPDGAAGGLPEAEAEEEVNSFENQDIRALEPEIVEAALVEEPAPEPPVFGEHDVYRGAEAPSQTPSQSQTISETEAMIAAASEPARPAAAPGKNAMAGAAGIASRFAPQTEPEPELRPELSAIATEEQALAMDTTELEAAPVAEPEISLQTAEQGSPRPMSRPQDA